jgi:hypothetical protein
MKNAVLFLVVIVTMIMTTASGARETESSREAEKLRMKALSGPAYPDPGNGRTVATQRAASADTTWLGYWSFDGAGGGCDSQGWVSADITEQIGEFFHVDDFAGLGGGSFGRLNPLEGDQSLWCGARPVATGPLCGYAALPGYGNNWTQRFCTVSCLDVEGDVTFDYLISWDTEWGYDFINVEFKNCDAEWPTSSGGYYGGGGTGLDGIGEPQFRSVPHADSLHSGQVHVSIVFRSDGAWSDQDGLWDTDGALIVDSLSVSDSTGIVLGVEDFEDETVGDTGSNDWVSCNEPGFGDFAAVYSGLTVLQEDLCNYDVSCLWTFFDGSTETYACGGFPAQPAVPKGNQRGQYIWNEVWSPAFPWTGWGSTAELAFDAYMDLPLDNLVFFVWHVRSIVDGCAGFWDDFGFVYYGGDGEWQKRVFPIGSFIDPAATDIQVALGTWDMCQFWCGVYGTGNCHSHAPMFDNVSVYRVNTQGPVWANRDIDLFQDNFATDGTLTGTVRADMANNTNNWGSSHNIIPGDSMVVEVNDPDYGLRLDPYTGTRSAVYAYVSVLPPNQPGKTGSHLTDDDLRWPVVDSLTWAGDTWYVVRADSILTSGGYYAPQNQFAIDLNDNLFTPGDTIRFFFRADSDAPSTDVTYWTRSTGTTADMYRAISNAMEFTCLPAGGFLRGGDILYVDQYDGYGGQQYFDTAFQILGLEGRVDRYDTRGPTSIAGNSPGGRVKNVVQQIGGAYRRIIWDSGSMTLGTIGDATSRPSYADDGTVLYQFLENLGTSGGLYLSGDNLPSELLGLSGDAGLLRNKYTSYAVSADDHGQAGFAVSPLVVGRPGSMFAHAFGPDTLVAYGGCPTLKSFDVLSPTGNSVGHAGYDGSLAPNHAAVVAQTTINPNSQHVGLVLSGFSFASIRDNRPGAIPARAEHLNDILTWLSGVQATPTDAAATVSFNGLDQNYPNPFNPATTIRYQVARTGPVSLKVYNVSGQLVRTLVDGRVDAGVLHEARWQGVNDAGQSVSSGVYFYKLVAGDFVETRKMVLLK